MSSPFSTSASRQYHCSKRNRHNYQYGFEYPYCFLYMSHSLNISKEVYISLIVPETRVTLYTKDVSKPSFLQDVSSYLASNLIISVMLSLLPYLIMSRSRFPCPKKAMHSLSYVPASNFKICMLLTASK